MNWFLLSLAAPALFAVCNFFDKILINKYFKGGGVGALAIYSALIGFIVVPLALLFNVNYISPGWFPITLMVLSGISYLLGVIPYLHALTEDDTSSIVPIFQTIPIFSFVLGYFFLGETITLLQFVGMILIIAGSIFMFVDMTGTKIRFKLRPVILMLLASLLLSVGNLVFKFVGVDYGFIITSFWTYIGYAVLGVLLLFIKSYRREFVTTMKINSARIIGLNTVNEIISVGGKMIQNFATLIAPLALVMTIQGFQPVFALIYGIILTIFLPHLLQEDIRKQKVLPKVLSIATIVVGAILLQTLNK